MKTRKKLFKGLLLVLVLVMLTSMFTACSKTANNEKAEPAKATETKKEAETKKEEVKEEVSNLAPDGTTFSMLYSDNASYQFKEDWMIMKEIKRMTNVDLEVIPVPESDWEAKRTIIINSGDMPDIISKITKDKVSEYCLSGTFLPITPYMDQMPHFTKFVDDFGYDVDINNLLKEADGNFYVLPCVANESRIQSHVWLARVDLYEKHGLELPKTMEDILETGKVLKEAYPESTPITNRFLSANILSMVSGAYGTKAGWTLPASGFILNEDHSEWIFAPTSDDYKEMLMFMNDLLEAGVLDVEFSTLDSNIYEQRVMNGTNLILADWVGNEIRYNLSGKENVGEEFNVQPIFPPKGPKGYALGHQALFEQGWVLNGEAANKDNFDEFLKFVDWFYSDEAAVATSFGVEGETFNYEGDKAVYIDGIKSGEIDHCKLYGIQNNCLTVRNHKDLFGSRKTDEIAQLYVEMSEANCVVAPQPALRLDADQKEEEKLYVATLRDYYNQMTEKFIYGKESFDNWDAYVVEAESKGAAKLRELYNGVWENQVK